MDDESNASWNNTPTGKEILSGAVASTKVQMHAGQNTVEFTYTEQMKIYCILRR